MSLGVDAACSVLVTTVAAVSFAELRVPSCTESALTASVAIFALLIASSAISIVAIVPSIMSVSYTHLTLPTIYSV